MDREKANPSVPLVKRGPFALSVAQAQGSSSCYFPDSASLSFTRSNVSSEMISWSPIGMWQ